MVIFGDDYFERAVAGSDEALEFQALQLFGSDCARSKLPDSWPGELIGHASAEF